MIPKFKNGYTVCESLADEFKKNYDANYQVIRNIPLLTETDEQAIPGYAILYQGAVNKGRGLDQLVIAMKDVDAMLWVCGDGNFMSEMKWAVKKNDLETKVIFYGMLEPAELKRKAGQAYIAINPFEKTGLNQYLSLSNKFFDYIHAAVPQVTMNYPEYRRINDQYKIAELIEDLEPSSIAKAINKLLNDKERYLQLKKNCIIARQEFNWQNEKNKLILFYEELFNDR